MLIKRIAILLPVIVFCFGACKQEYDHKGKNPLVEMDGSFLYQEDLMAALPAGLTGKDSADFADRFIRNWIEETLLYEKAENNIPDNAELEQRMQAYRKALVLHTYQQELVRQKMAAEVTEQEVAGFYEANQTLFVLSSPLVKGLYLKVPLTAPKLNNVRRWYASQDQKAIDQLEKYSLQNAVKYDYFLDKWVPVAEILDKLPNNVALSEEYINRNRKIELRDAGFYYFLHVTDFRASGEIEPYEAARWKVQELLLQQKQSEFLQQAKADLYQQAMEKNKINYHFIKSEE